MAVPAHVRAAIPLRICRESPPLWVTTMWMVEKKQPAKRLVTHAKYACDHICHDENIFKKFIWFIMNVWNQFLGINDTCKCGLKHYTKTSNLVVNG